VRPQLALQSRQADQPASLHTLAQFAPPDRVQSSHVWSPEHFVSQSSRWALHASSHAFSGWSPCPASLPKHVASRVKTLTGVPASYAARHWSALPATQVASSPSPGRALQASTQYRVVSMFPGGGSKEVQASNATLLGPPSNSMRQASIMALQFSTLQPGCGEGGQLAKTKSPATTVILVMAR
jgi:hypothetical protein